MSSVARDARIRGHRLALQNALGRGDERAAKEQRRALRELGASVPRSGGSRSLSGYRANPARKKPAAKKPAARKPATKKPAARKPATKKPASKPRASRPRQSRPSSGAAPIRALPPAQEHIRVTTSDGKTQTAAIVPARSSTPASTRTRSKGAKSASRSKTMKRTKAERSASAKKAARTRKRNQAKGTSAKASSRKGKRSKASYQAAAKKAAATRRRNARAAGKAPARKGKGKRRYNRGFGLPKGFRRIDQKSIIRARSRKTGEIRTVVKYRRFKSNPIGDVAKIAMLGGGVVLGLVLSDMLRRYVATMAPKGGKEPFYGTPAAERTTVAPDAMQLGAQLGLAALFGGGAFLVRKKSPGAMTFLAGAAIGAGGLAILEAINFFMMPKILPAKTISEKVLGNRLYVVEQKYGQDYLNDDIKKQNAAIEAGKTVNPDGGAVMGVRGVGSAPQHRALPPPARANAVAGAPQRQGNSVSGPPQQNAVGCGGGCGQGGCSGGRNCGCASCSGGMSEALLPPRGTQMDTFPRGGGQSAPRDATVATSNGGTPALSEREEYARRQGGVSGPRQLGAPRSVGIMPARSQGPAVRMAFSR